ncbi:MAG: biotin transporter BioY [Halobacteria archaeon]
MAVEEGYEEILELEKIRMLVYSSLFASMISVGAFIVIPLPPVPITLQTFFVALTGLMLGGYWGAVTIMVYLLVGFAGLPVFSGMTGGIAHIVGPSGGFLIGFLVGVYVIGVLRERIPPKIDTRVWSFLSVVAGFAVIYTIGAWWLMVITGLTLTQAFVTGVAVFLPGAVIKTVAAVTVAEKIKYSIKAGPYASET